MAVVLDGKSLTLEKLVRIAREGEPVEVPPEAIAKIKACREMLEEKIKAGEIMRDQQGIVLRWSSPTSRWPVPEVQSTITPPASAIRPRSKRPGGVAGRIASMPNTRAAKCSDPGEMLNKGVTPVVCRKDPSALPASPMSQVALLPWARAKRIRERLAGRVALERATSVPASSPGRAGGHQRPILTAIMTL